MRAASIVNKSTYYLLSLEPVKRSGRRHVATYGFTRVRSSRDSHSRESSPSPPPAAPARATRTRGDRVITSATSHDAGKYGVRSIDNIQNHPVRLAGARPTAVAAINSKLSFYFPNVRSSSPFFLFLPRRVSFSRRIHTCHLSDGFPFPFCYSSRRFARDPGSDDTTAPWRSPGSRSRSTKRIR